LLTQRCNERLELCLLSRTRRKEATLQINVYVDLRLSWGKNVYLQDVGINIYREMFHEEMFYKVMFVASCARRNVHILAARPPGTFPCFVKKTISGGRTQSPADFFVPRPKLQPLSTLPMQRARLPREHIEQQASNVFTAPGRHLALELIPSLQPQHSLLFDEIHALR
jgi:hypothetical protein